MKFRTTTIFCKYPCLTERNNRKTVASATHERAKGIFRVAAMLMLFIFWHTLCKSKHRSKFFIGIARQIAHIMMIYIKFP